MAAPPRHGAGEGGDRDPGERDPGGRDPGGRDPADRDPADRDPGRDPGGRDPGGRDPADRDPGGQDPACAEYDDYWHEIINIEQDEEEGQEEDCPKTPDEGEQEMAWLQDAGYGHLVDKLEGILRGLRQGHYNVEGRELEEDILMKETASLTSTQAEAVKRRVDTVNATIRSKYNKSNSRRMDVRDIFNQPPDANERAETKSVSSRSGGVLRKGSKRPDPGSFLKRGVYSMVRGMDPTEDDIDARGVETISIQSKGAPESRPATMATSRKLDRQASSGGNDMNLSFSVLPPTKDGSSHSNSSDDLPTIVLEEDVLGVTQMTDLSRADMARVRALALIELSALFDTNSITYTRRKPKRRVKDHGVFGVPITTLLDHDQRKCPALRVPRIFLELITYLERTGLSEEGILRVPGSASRIKSLQAEIDSQYPTLSFRWDEVMPNDAAGLMKQFIRELPSPLLTFEYIDAFAQVQSVEKLKLKVQALNLLVLLLPDAHRDTLQMLLSFLKKVVDNEANKMSLHNVSMIMAPNLFLIASNRRRKGRAQDEVVMAAGTSNIVRMLIKYQHLLWTVPSFMISQIRHQYEAHQLRKLKEKPLMKLIGRRDKSEVYRKPAIQQENDYQQGVIRVLAPHQSKYQTPIQLVVTTCATDVINKFRRRTLAGPTSAEMSNGRSNSGGERFQSGTADSKLDLFEPDQLNLYEVGGNIGERKLSPNTNMLSLLRVNPNAEWIIRIKTS